MVRGVAQYFFNKSSELPLAASDQLNYALKKMHLSMISFLDFKIKFQSQIRSNVCCALSLGFPFLY